MSNTGWRKIRLKVNMNEGYSMRKDTNGGMSKEYWWEKIPNDNTCEEYQMQKWLNSNKSQKYSLRETKLQHEWRISVQEKTYNNGLHEEYRMRNIDDHYDAGENIFVDRVLALEVLHEDIARKYYYSALEETLLPEDYLLQRRRKIRLGNSGKKEISPRGNIWDAGILGQWNVYLTWRERWWIFPVVNLILYLARLYH